MDNFDKDYNNYEGQPNHEINSKYGKSNDSGYGVNMYGFDHRSYSADNDEEFAAEFLQRDYTHGDSTTGALIAGGLGLLLSIIALFRHPVLFGLMGVVLGIYGVAKGNKTLGFLAIAVGLVASLASFIVAGAFLAWLF